MPSKNRDYKEEYRRYHSKPEQRKRRSARNKARRKMVALGKARKGDGKDVHHKKPLDKGGSTKKSNTKVVSQKTNRGWRKKNPEMYTKRGKK